jgi:hypothetical protein
VIVIFVELWKRGDPGRRVELGRATITNDASGSLASGNYSAAFYGRKQRPMGTSRVADFPRRRLLAWDLVFRALRPVFEARNPHNVAKCDVVRKVLSDLRHAYSQGIRGDIRDQRLFVEGLIAPAIRKLEELDR